MGSGAAIDSRTKLRTSHTHTQYTRRRQMTRLLAGRHQEVAWWAWEHGCPRPNYSPSHQRRGRAFTYHQLFCLRIFSHHEASRSAARGDERGGPVKERVGGNAQAGGVLHVAAGLGQGERLSVGCADMCARRSDRACCSGRGRTAARGIRGPAPKLLAGNLRCCSGRGSTGARGTRLHVRAPRRAGTWRCCGGRGSKNARGMRGRAPGPLGAGTWRC